MVFFLIKLQVYVLGKIFRSTFSTLCVVVSEERKYWLSFYEGIFKLEPITNYAETLLHLSIVSHQRK